MRTLRILTAVSFLLLMSCQDREEGSRDEMVPGDQSNYEVASERYSDLSDEALDRMSSLDFDFWGEMLAENVEYYFPDGDAETRTILRGKSTVVDCGKNGKQTPG